MFYITEVEDYIRVEPKLFGLPTLEAVDKQLREFYKDYYDQDLGKVVAVVDVMEIGEGVIIPGDGAAYYNSKFKLLVWKPEIQEIIYGEIAEITNFGAFINMGVMKGMIHIGQTMDDYVSFSKSNTLLGKASKRILKGGDLCVARIVAISHKGDDPKIGLTMRQPGLGKLDWIKEDQLKKDKAAKIAIKAEEKTTKGKEAKVKEKGGKEKMNDYVGKHANEVGMKDLVGMGLIDPQGKYIGRVTNLQGPSRILIEGALTIHKDHLSKYKVTVPEDQ